MALMDKVRFAACREIGVDEFVGRRSSFNSEGLGIGLRGIEGWSYLDGEWLSELNGSPFFDEPLHCDCVRHVDEARVALSLNVNAKAISRGRGILWWDIDVCCQSYSSVLVACRSTEKGLAKELVDLCGNRVLIAVVSTHSGHNALRRKSCTKGIEVTRVFKHGAGKAYAVGEHFMQLFRRGLHVFPMPNYVYLIWIKSGCGVSPSFLFRLNERFHSTNLFIHCTWAVLNYRLAVLSGSA